MSKKLGFSWLFIVLLLMPVTAYAGTGLLVTPAKSTLELAGGYFTTRDMWLRNTGNEPVFVSTAFAEIAKNKEGTSQSLVYNQQKKGITNWLGVQPAQVTLQPGETSKLKLTIAVPADAHSGSNRAAVVFSLMPPNQFENEQNSAIVGRVVSVVEVNLPGNYDQGFELRKFSVPLLSMGKQIAFSAELANTSKSVLHVSGQLEIKDMQERLVLELSLPKEKVTTGAGQAWALKTRQALPWGIYQCSLSLTNGSLSKGPYTKTMVVFPWVGVFGLGLILMSSYALRKGSRQKTRD